MFWPREVAWPCAVCCDLAAGGLAGLAAVALGPATTEPCALAAAAFLGAVALRPGSVRHRAP